MNLFKKWRHPYEEKHAPGSLKMFTAPWLRRFILLTVPAILFFCAGIGCRATPAPKPYQAPVNAAAVSGRPIVFMTASELAEAIRSGKMTSVEVVSAHINHIHKYNPGLNAIVFIDENRPLKGPGRRMRPLPGAKSGARCTGFRSASKTILR